MSLDDLPIVQSINEQLHALLDKARTVKPSDSIDPPLSLPDFEREIHAIAQIPLTASSSTNLKPSPSTVPQQTAFEAAARQLFYEQLALYVNSDGSFVEICNLLDIVQFCADAAQCDANLPLSLVEELLDSQTIEGCKRVFDFLESRRQRMITSVFGKNKQLVLLRSCNELIRRLSRAEDAVFCGRVFMFLFQSFPLGDKSSVNLRGEFHVENTTTFDAPRAKRQETGLDGEDGSKMEVDGTTHVEESTAVKDEKTGTSAPNGTATDSSKPADNGPPSIRVEDTDAKKTDTAATPSEEPDMDTLYTMFWSMQSVFSNPGKLFVPAEFEAFQKGLEATLHKFKSVPKIPQTRNNPVLANGGATDGDELHGIKRKRIDDEEDDNDDHHPNGDAFAASNFNPKYLTSRDLFELEISDLTFQRDVLVQALIILDFLLSLTPKMKKRLTDLKAQKAMLYNFTLSHEDTAWANTTRNTIINYLSSALDGKFYSRMISTVLSRDKNWVRWKTLSCPPISLPAVTPQQYTAAMNSAATAFAPRRIRATPLGAGDLSFLADSAEEGDDPRDVAERHLALMRDPKRFLPPVTVEYLVKKAQAVELDMEFVERGRPSQVGEPPTQWEALNNEKNSYVWRALRLTAMDRIGLLDKVRDGGDLSVLVPKSVEEVGKEVEEKMEVEEDGDGEEHGPGDGMERGDVLDDADVPGIDDGYDDGGHGHGNNIDDDMRPEEPLTDSDPLPNTATPSPHNASLSPSPPHSPPSDTNHDTTTAEDAEPYPTDAAAYAYGAHDNDDDDELGDEGARKGVRGVEEHEWERSGEMEMEVEGDGEGEDRDELGD